MYENLMRGGVVNASGEAPLLVAREKDPKKSGHLMLTFQYVGVPLEKMKDMSSVIAACIGMYVVDIQDGVAPYTYIIDVVADSALPTMIAWTAERMPVEETKFALGEAIDGPVYIDVQNDPGILVAGATGSGKSIETKVILAQAILRDYFAIIADYKYVEYSSVWAASAHIVHDDDNLLWTMEHLLKRLHDRRDCFAAEGCRNIDDYNALHPDKKMHRNISKVKVGDDIAMQLIQNRGGISAIQVRNLSDADKAVLFGRLVNEERLGFAQLSRLTGISKGEIKRLLLQMEDDL